MEKRKRTIAITSGKGGVGKTSIVSNIGYLLSRMGKTVYVLDADLSLGNIDVMFGIFPRFNIKDFLEGRKNLEEIIVEKKGIKIIPATSGAFEFSNLSEFEKSKILSSLRQLDGYDFMIIDTAAGISSNVVYFNNISEEVFVVMTPEPASITDSYAVIKVLRKKTDRREFKLIVNMARDEKEAEEIFLKLLSVTDKFLDVYLEFYGFIPLDRNIGSATKRQKLWAECFPESLGTKALIKICEKLLR